MADIAESLKRYDDEVHPSGETLPVSTRVIVTALLKAGVSLSKLDSFQDIFEENVFALSDSSHLRRLILQDEMCKLKQDIGGKHL